MSNDKSKDKGEGGRRGKENKGKGPRLRTTVKTR